MTGMVKGRRSGMIKPMPIMLLLLSTLLGLAACGGSATTGSTLPGNQSAPVGPPGSSGGTVTLTGAGSTFINPFFSQAFAQYNKDHPNVRVNYQSIGSGGGIKQFTAKTVDFGASDVPMNQQELAAAQQANGSVIQIPVALGAVAIAYHLPGVPSGLKLTPEAIAGIFLGKITKWNDPAIAGKNPGVQLPAQDIAVVHRSDGSGTTYIFTDYLAHISSDWKQGRGTGKEISWPIGVGGKGNEGVAAQVQQAPGGIGYVELAYAKEAQMTYANVQNQDGQFVEPTLDATTAAASQVPMVSPTNFSIVNASGATSYPIVGYSWALLWQRYSDAQKAQALNALMDWIVTDAQSRFATQLNYAPLPDPVQTLAKDSMAKVQGG